MIKNWKLFLEDNSTEQHEEKLLRKYFDLTSEDIKDFVQDFLDEHLDLDFEVMVVNYELFIINFFEVDSESRVIVQGKITRDKYPFPEESFTFLKSRLKDYDCYPLDVHYDINNRYISINVNKIFS